MRIMHDITHYGREVGPMPTWQRWLCVLLAAVLSPLWIPALLVVLLMGLPVGGGARETSIEEMEKR